MTRIAASERLSRTAFLWLLLLSVFALAAGIGLREPTPPDEPRFVLAARTMVETGQWLFPHRGSELYAEKPATFMWLQAASYEVLHNWRIAFLLPSLLFALLSLWLLHDLGRTLWNRQTGRYAALAACACFLQFGLMAKRAQIDMTVTGMMTLSLWGLLRHLLRGPDWRAAWLGCFAAGVGTVTKGVGFLPLLVLVPFFATKFARKFRFDEIGTDFGAANLGRSALAFAFFLLGCGVWLLPMLHAAFIAHNPALDAYAHEILFKQTATRYTSAWHHVQPWWYFAQVIATLWLPAPLLLPWLAPAWWRRIVKRLDLRYALIIGWGLLVLLFFSASPGKREVYILPALPAFALAIAPLLPGLLKRAGVRRVLITYMGAIGVAATLMALSALSGRGHWADKTITEHGLDPRTVRSLLLWLLALGAAGIACALWAWKHRVFPALVAMHAALWIVFGFGITTALDADSSAQGLMQRVGQRIGQSAQLGMIGWKEQNLLQADRPARDFGFKARWQQQWNAASAWLAENPRNRWLFVYAPALSPCVDKSQTVNIGQSNRRDWLLVPGEAYTPGCVTPPLSGDEQGEETN